MLVNISKKTVRKELFEDLKYHNILISDGYIVIFIMTDFL